jgi:hypothetical protein
MMENRKQGESAPGPWQEVTEAVIADEQAAIKLAGLEAAIVAISEEIDHHLMHRKDPVLDALHEAYESAIRAKEIMAEAAARG